MTSSDVKEQSNLFNIFIYLFFVFLFDAFIFIEILSLLSKIKYQWEKKNISIFWKKHIFLFDCFLFYSYLV